MPQPQTQQIYLDSETTLTVIYQVTLGELVLSTMLLLLVLLFVLKWLHTLIMERNA
ncbi:hypothetical protein P9314_05250 [Paenibacillus validus]|uniref:hypothetical protein n=1 Tax=Paenibacillus validus TaxID=44253 RepID=UPI0013DFAAA6|nr:hypothetical protein [Paenibacillus validus]MED4600116.1 hypothetical protein [Paenibacillus validus]MED4605563.1 hypothetical protein [Paenibacillus validus]